MPEFENMLDYAEHLKNIHADRNATCDEMEDMYFLEWDDETAVKAKMDNVKLTKSPDAKNKLDGAIRLLTATDPVFSVPVDKNEMETEGISSKLETVASQIWQAAGRVKGNPCHYDVVFSMLCFGETNLAITRTADLVRYAKGASKAAQARIESIAEQAPFLFDVWDPRTCYSDLTSTGLQAFYREVVTTTGKVLDDFGDDARAQLSDDRYAATTLCHFWDFDNRYIWLKGKTKPLVEEKHGLPFIPIVVTLGEGTNLFTKPEQNRLPFLYTLWKSGIWERESLALTVIFTMMFAVGSNPMFLYRANQEGKELIVDHSTPGKVAVIGPGEDFGPLMKNVIDPSFITGLQLTGEKTDESTIYSQTLGQPIGRNATFSETSLLSQSGRLPLTIPQRKASWCIGDAIKIAFKWAREDGWGEVGSIGGLKKSDIPKKFEIECRLDISLPQDLLQQTQVANMATQGESPLASLRYAREKFLNIGQSDMMTKEIWTERAEQLRFIQFLKQQQMAMEQAQQAQQAMQQQQMQAQQQGQMAGGMAQPGMQPGPEQMPPEQQGMAPNQQAMMEQAMAQQQGQQSPPNTPPPQYPNPMQGVPQQ